MVKFASLILIHFSRFFSVKALLFGTRSKFTEIIYQRNINRSRPWVNNIINKQRIIFVHEFVQSFIYMKFTDIYLNTKIMRERIFTGFLLLIHALLLKSLLIFEKLLWKTITRNIEAEVSNSIIDEYRWLIIDYTLFK